MRKNPDLICPLLRRSLMSAVLLALPGLALAAGGPPPPPTISQPELQQMQSQSLTSASNGGSGVTDSNLNDSGAANGTSTTGASATAGTSGSSGSAGSSSSGSGGVPTNFAALPNGSWVQGSWVACGDSAVYCACNAANGNFVQSSDLLTSQQNLEQAILAVGKVLNTGQMQQMSANEQELNQVLQEQTQFQNLLSVAQDVNQTNTAISNTLTTTIGSQTVSLNQPGSLCNETDMAQSLGQGMAVNRQLAANFGAVLAGYDQGDVSAMDSLKNLAQAPTSTLSAASIFPTAMASSVYPSPAAAAQTIAHLTEPVPPVQLSSDQKKNGAGILWKAHENAIQAKMSMAQNALATIAVWHQPTIKATYFVTKWQSMQPSSSGGASSSLPPGVNNNNQISPDGALNLMIEKSYANANWYSQLAVQNETGAIKDLTSMEAVSLRVHWEALRMSEYLAGLSADQYAHAVVTPTNNALNALNGSAMAQTNGAFNGQ